MAAILGIKRCLQAIRAAYHDDVCFVTVGNNGQAHGFLTDNLTLIKSPDGRERQSSSMYSPTHSQGLGTSPATLFTDPAAVEAWDHWFRWRDEGVLRDLTIDATWRRVAEAIASVEGDQAPVWTRRFVEAFSGWRILPDPRLLRLAGTGKIIDSFPSPRVVVNAAAFVAWPNTARALFERDRFVDAAALSVRLLDDILLASKTTSVDAQARIGIIGLADALQRLGLEYASEIGRRFASDIAAALAAGTLRGGTQLAVERGADDCDRELLAEQWRKRGAPAALVDEVLHSGLRHAQLTAIDSQPYLALLANNTSDALDPADSVPLSAQIELRAAMQPWLDAPIDYPLVYSTEPDPQAVEVSQRLAAKHGLRPAALRRARTLSLNDEVE
jgi:ribonucleoside-diphosphate reductase alpha chain